MQKQRQIIAIFITLSWLFWHTSPTQACSLALHDWHLLFHLRIPVSAPIVPLAEVAAISDRLPRNSIKEVYWVSRHNLISAFSLAFLHLLPNWEAHIPWYPVTDNTSLIKMARERQNEQETPLIVGSDQTQLQIAFFGDRNSANRCFQLVIMQSSRIRAVYPSKQAPWAQEIRGTSWISVVFFQLPIPDRVLSFAFFPYYHARKALIDNHGYAEHLVAEELLLKRPEQVFDPYTFDFPDLPE